MTKAIWWDGNSVTCVAHMGFTLKCELEAHPRRKKHVTTFGEAYLIPDYERFELVNLMGEELCETCAEKVDA